MLQSRVILVIIALMTNLFRGKSSSAGIRIGIDARLWFQTGVGRYIRNLVQNLLILDKKNTYILFVRKQDCGIINDQLSMINYQNNLEIGNWKLKIADIKWHTVSEQTRFASILNKEKLDLVHFPYFSVPIFYNRPFVVTIHDLIVHHFPTGKASTLILPLYETKLLAYKLIIKKAAQKAKKIITVSSATKKEIIDHLKVDKNKVVVIYNGVDKGVSTKERNTGDKIPEIKYFLYVGNAYPHKNLERLLLAFSKFSLNNKNIKLVLVGKEDYFYKRLKEKIKSLKLGDSVIFYKNAADEDLANLYKNALALVMPSLMEGFGLPVLEAMANGCPVLASDTPSLKETGEDAALYFNPEDTEDIKNNLESIMNNSELRERLIKKGYEQVKKFSWEESARETLKVYESCASASSA